MSRSASSTKAKSEPLSRINSFRANIDVKTAMNQAVKVYCCASTAWAVAATVFTAIYQSGLLSAHRQLNHSYLLGIRSTGAQENVLLPLKSEGGMEVHLLRNGRATQRHPKLQLPVQVLKHGLQGRIHQEPAYTVWKESIIMAGGMNVTRADGSRVSQPGGMSAQESKEVFWGSYQVTVFNMSDHSVRSGPDVPLRSQHGMAAMSPEGRMHLLCSTFYLLPSDNPTEETGLLRHLVWDFAGGGNAWEERAPLLGISGAGRCHFVGHLLYCFGGAVKTGAPKSNLLHIYNPSTDVWRQGSSMPEAGDHIASVEHDGKIWATSLEQHHDFGKAGTRGWIAKGPASGRHMMYDTATDVWTDVEPLPYRRSSAHADVVQRPGKRATMLTAGGGMKFTSRTGIVFGMVEEYDFEEDAWFCYEAHMPHPFYGASVGSWNGKMYFVSGADSFYLSGVDSVMVLDTLNMGTPVPCLYKDNVRPDWWNDRETGLVANYPYRKQFLDADMLPPPIVKQVKTSSS